MRQSIFLLACGVTALASVTWTHPSMGGYLPGPDSSVGEIQHECVEEFPSPRTRTDIGIGEEVNMWIDADSWHDEDIYIDPETEEEETVWDSIGEVIWSVEEGFASVYPIVGLSTVLTADKVNQENQIQVKARIWDSLQKGIDGMKERIKFVMAKTPQGTGIVLGGVLTLAPPAGWTVQQNGPNMGQSNLYQKQVWPILVNFKKLEFRENIAQQAINWPDGTTTTLAAEIVGPRSVSTEPLTNLVNRFDDALIQGLTHKNRLLNNGKFTQQFNVTRDVPLDWKDKNNQWIQFTVEQHTRIYSGATFKCRSRVTTVINTKEGTDQGPWQ